MQPDKSPGPNGMNPAFYQNIWSIVRKDIIAARLSVLSLGVLPAGFNDTQLILIPKKQQAEVMGDMRPISLCNVIYKIVAKTVANRLKRVLPKVVSSS